MAIDNNPPCTEVLDHACTKVLDHGFVALLDVMGNDLKVANTARVSFGKKSEEFTERDAKLLRYLAENEHTSPFRHCHLTFHIKAPLAIKAQFDKHISGVSCNSASGRYRNLSEDVFYVPAEFRKQAKDNKQASEGKLSGAEEVTAWLAYKRICEECFKTYDSLINLGVAREQARLVLPTALFTEFHMTLSLQALAHFIELREHPHSQWEIQQYAIAMKELALPHFPHSLALLLETSRVRAIGR